MNKVLKLLKKRPKQGVSAKDFPVGFRLSAAIYKLRCKNYLIDTIQTDKTKNARYVLSYDDSTRIL